MDYSHFRRSENVEVQSDPYHLYRLYGALGLTNTPVAGLRELLRPTTPANAGEQDLYVRDPATGQMVPNPANPAPFK